MLAIPWWIYFILAGVIFSGYMMMKTMKEDYDVEQEFIEQEGQVYIDRIQQERKRRA